MKAATPMLYFIVAIIYVKDYDDFQKLNRTSIWLIVLFILNILIANIFDLGKIQYKDEETLDVGNIYTTGLNSMAYILILAPYYILVYKFKNKFTMILYFTTAFTAFVIMVILMKRASLLALFVGYLILFLTFDFKNKTKLLGILSIFTLTIILTFPLYRNLVLERYEARMNRMQLESYESEGRYLENKYVLDEIFSFQDLKYSFLGREMFNSPGNYANGRFGRRQLHNDYSRLLNGSGLIGLLFHFIMNFSILMIFIKLKVKLKKNNQWERDEKILNSLFISYFLMYFVIGISGGIDGTLFTGIRYIYMGSIIGILYRKNQHLNNNTKDNYTLLRESVNNKISNSNKNVLQNN